MDKKIILNSKMNWHIFVTNFWLAIGNFSSKTTGFAIEKAKNNVKKNIEIVEEMTRLDYSNAFNTELEELNGKGS